MNNKSKKPVGRPIAPTSLPSRALAYILANKGASLEQIGKHLGIEGSQVRGVMGELKKRGLAHSVPVQWRAGNPSQ